MIVIKIEKKSKAKPDLQLAADTLNNGGIIAYPTETVYGLGADIANRAAVERIYAIKGRSAVKPLSILLARRADVDILCKDIPQFARKLMRHYWPGPLTLVLRAGSHLPEHMAGPGGTIGVRLTSHAVISALMKVVGKPITTTSANLSGQPPAIDSLGVERTLSDKIDLLIDAGACPGQIPSTVVDATGTGPVILRQGAISIGQIIKYLQGENT